MLYSSICSYLPHFPHFQAFLKKTGVCLDYIYNRDILDMLRKNLRGGLSFPSQRYSILYTDNRNKVVIIIIIVIIIHSSN